MRSPAAVVFDCDGVLVDSEVIAIEVEVTALGEIGVHLTPAELAERYVGMSGAAMRTAVVKEFEVDLDDAFWSILRDRTHAALTSRLCPINGIAGLVSSLPMPYCLASSSSHERIELSLRAAGLLQLFPPSVRFSAEDVTRGKPAPDLFLHAARSLDIAPSRCVVVEDSPYGVAAALAAGMGVIGFSGGGHADAAWAKRLVAAGAPTVVDEAAALSACLGV